MTKERGVATSCHRAPEMSGKFLSSERRVVLWYVLFVLSLQSNVDAARDHLLDYGPRKDGRRYDKGKARGLSGRSSGC